MTYEARCWAALWRAAGEEYLIHRSGLPVLFYTRQAARDWIKENYGYIAKRKDLRAPPFCWRMPTAIRVRVSI
jgi:hypothetical protein